MTRAYYLSITGMIIAVDAWTKFLIMSNFDLHRDSLVVIQNFFQIVHVRNSGAAFGIGANSNSPLVPWLLNAGAIGVFAFVAWLAFRSSLSDRLLQIGLHLIMGGAIGNLIDRFRLGSVVDFLDVFIVISGREHHWPAFNVADSAICVGIGLLFLDMWRNPDREPVEAA